MGRIASECYKFTKSWTAGALVHVLYQQKMPLITKLPHSPTLSFYRSALRTIRLGGSSNGEPRGLPEQLSHLQRKLQHNIRDGISIYRLERDQDTISSLIQGGEDDLAMIRVWNSVDPSWLERLFKKPTPKSS